MQRYGDHGDSTEREPLDGYGTQSQRAASPDSHAYSPQEYHDQHQPPPVPQHQSQIHDYNQGQGYDHGYDQNQSYAYDQGYDHDYRDDAPPPPQHQQGGNRMQSDSGYFAGGGARNDGDMASGGMAGIAYGVAERNARESGMQAAHGGLPPPP